MKRILSSVVLAAVVGTTSFGCGGEEPRDGQQSSESEAPEECVAGKISACDCSGETTGKKRCLESGTWGECDCGAPAPDAGPDVDTVDLEDSGSPDAQASPSWGHPTDIDRTLVAKRASENVSIDGALEEPDYAGADRISIRGDSAGSDNQTTFRALWDETRLYVGLEVEDEELATPSERDIWRRDSVQIYLDRRRDRHSEGMLADDYNLIVDAEGRTLVRQGDADGQIDVDDVDLEVAVAESPDGFRVEMAVPWEDLEADPTLGQRMGFLVANHDRTDDEYVSYAWGVDGEFGFPSKWGDLRLGPENPSDDPDIEEDDGSNDDDNPDNRLGCDIFSEPPGSNVVDLGDEGLEPGDEIDPYLDEWFDDGNEVHIPEGTYRWNGDGTGGTHADASLIGDGEVVLDTGGGHTWNANFAADGDVEIRNITIKGQAANRSGSHGKIRVWAPSSDATIVARNFNQPDGSDDGASRVGIYVPGDHAGEFYLVDSHIEGFGNNGLYASSPGKRGSDRGDGAVHVIRGFFRNNNIADVRLGSSGSSARGVVSVQDEQAPSCCGGAQNQRGIWVREPGDNIRIEDVHVTYDASGSGPIQVKARDGGGSGSMEDVRVYNETSQTAVDVLTGEWSGTGFEITGGGDLSVDGGDFSDVCTGSSCDRPRTEPLPACGE